ncbi:hypothetical protein [Cystobacter fuscus]|uniref:hypothetical protein n=1 Tax=Cystobacter fuscus TaxID=43 RepID=UPI002B2CB5D9|nr:hypothetical protein F0U63_01700 [Cystobacter fuscus]
MTLGWVAAGTVGLMSFTSHAQAPANVVFLLDNSEAMQNFVEFLPEAATPGYYPTPEAPLPGEQGYNGPYGHFTNTGCTDPALVEAMSWFDKSSEDPARNGSVIVDSDPSLGSRFFEPEAFYHSRGRRVAWQSEEFPYSMGSVFTSLQSTPDAQLACRQVWNFDSKFRNSPLWQECLSCLESKGWWRGPIVPADINDKSGHLGPPRAKDEPPLPPEAKRKWVVSGRILNLRPPKFVVARKAIKEAIASASHVRIGVASVGREYGWFDPPELFAELRPSCDLSTPVIDEAGLDRPRLNQAVNQTLFRNNARSIGESLFGLGGYFSSEKVDSKWSGWFAQPITPGAFGWPGCCNGGTTDNPYTGRAGATWAATSDEWLKLAYTDPVSGSVRPGQPWETGGNERSICSSDQASAIILVSGGAPQYDNSVPITKMVELLKANGITPPHGVADPNAWPDPRGVNYCYLFGTSEDCDYTDYNWPTGPVPGNKNYMDDVAFFLSHTDLRGDLSGSQKVRTYVVGYGTAHPMLQSIAVAGQGSFFQASQPAALRDALQQALTEIRSATP